MLEDLLKTVNSLFGKANVSRKLRIRVTRRLLHVNWLINKTMQKGIIHIKLTKVLIFHEDKSKNNMNCGILDNWTQGVSKIEIGNLNETLSNQTSLVANRTIIKVLRAEIHLESTILVFSGLGTRI